MTIKETKHRTYIVDDSDKRKMIPKKYLEVVYNIDKYNFDNVFLSKHERFLLEVELLIDNLRSNEPFVFEKIKGKKPKKVYSVESKFGEDRIEVRLGNFDVKCQSEILKYAPKKMITKKYSNH